ncbi:MAG TPA: lipoyl(octanoyl) transferase LipB [Polyangiaceae bacterium]|nr:lipoyl(octanoyl) transferase LipB [Polyangiaceae bacterium]
MSRTLRGVWLGQRPYSEVVALQERLLAERQAERGEDTVLLLEHPPVVTLGRGAKPEHLLATPEGLAELGIAVEKTSRGGDVTLHAPGQLVAYPIVDLNPDRRDVRRFVQALTETMRRLVAELGVASGTHPKHVGLWADRADPRKFEGSSAATDLVKLGAIGVRISRWVTMHGFALNLVNDLALYGVIVPCGIREHGVATVASLGGRAVTPEALAPRALEILAEVTEARVTAFERR